MYIMSKLRCKVSPFSINGKTFYNKNSDNQHIFAESPIIS